MTRGCLAAIQGAGSGTVRLDNARRASRHCAVASSLSVKKQRKPFSAAFCVFVRTLTLQVKGCSSESSRANADNRLSRASLGRVKGGDGIVEGRDFTDVRPQSSVPYALDDLIQLATIGLDNEVNRQAVGGP